MSLGPTLRQLITNLPNYYKFKNTLPSDFQFEYILETWVQLNGITYHKNMAVAMFLCDNFIVFGEIRYIVINKMREVAFICIEYHTKQANRHYCAFEIVEKPRSWCFILIQDLFSYIPCNTHIMSDGNVYISGEFM